MAAAKKKSRATKTPAKKAAADKRVPKTSSTAKKAPVKAAAKKTSAASKRAPAKKAVSAKKTSAKKAAVKKPTAKKAAVKKKATAKAPAKKAAAKKPAAKKAAAKKSTAKKATAKKAPAKKATAKKASSKTASSPIAAPKTPASAPAKKAPPKPKKLRIPKFLTDKEWLDGQIEMLNYERAKYTRSAEHLAAEAASLMADRDPGDVQFDEESGEGDTIAVERDRDLALSASARNSVNEIDDALKRIANGTYGICLQGPDIIPKERLEAIPEASVCVQHKTAMF